MRKIMNTFDPVRLKRTDDKMFFSVWNRKYTFDKTSPMPCSVVSNSKELLAGPITFNAVINGEKVEFEDSYFCDIEDDDQSGESKTAVTAARAGTLVVNTSHCVEFDGCDIVHLTIMPSGKSISELFGLSEDYTQVMHLDSFWLDVPVTKEYIKYFQVFDCGEFNGTMSGKKKFVPNDSLHTACEIPEGGMNFSFKEQILLLGHDVGIGFFFRDDEKWAYKNKDTAAEIIDCEDKYILRFHIFDYEPPCWNYKGQNNEKWKDLYPITIKFGMQVTPIKPIPKELEFERNLHFDCYKRIKENHDEYLSRPIKEGESEIAFDRLQRLGVKVLYIHEKWNDIQNSFLLTSETSRRLKYIIEECHKRDIKVVPYFGYEISTLSPLYNKVGDKYYKARKEGIDLHWQWYRTPEQRDLFACMGSGWGDMFYEGLKKLIEKYNFDGFYFDGTCMPSPCARLEHGCGYIDCHGELQETHPVFEIREFMKKIYRLVSERNGIVNIHLGGAHNIAAMGFSTSIWDGEVFQSMLLKGELDEMPDELLRAQYDSHNTGVPMQALCYSNPPTWTFNSAIGMMLLHGCFPKPNDIEEPLEIMSRIWDTFDAFKGGEILWRPYYNPSGRVVCETEGVKVSCYEKESEILAVVATDNKNFGGKATVKSCLANVSFADSGKTISNNGIAEIQLNGFDFAILKFEK